VDNNRFYTYVPSDEITFFLTVLVLMSKSQQFALTSLFHRRSDITYNRRLLVILLRVLFIVDNSIMIGLRAYTVLFGRRALIIYCNRIWCYRVVQYFILLIIIIIIIIIITLKICLIYDITRHTTIILSSNNSKIIVWPPGIYMLYNFNKRVMWTWWLRF